MDKLILLITITTFSIVILSGRTTLNLSRIIQTKLKSDETTSRKDILERIGKTYKILSWIGVTLYLMTLQLYESRVNFNIATLILMGYNHKYYYVTYDNSGAYRMSDDFIEHPLSVTLDVLTNLGIALQSIWIFMQL